MGGGFCIPHARIHPEFTHVRFLIQAHRVFHILASLRPRFFRIRKSIIQSLPRLFLPLAFSSFLDRISSLCRVVEMFIQNFRVESPNVKYSEESIDSIYDYQMIGLVHENVNGKYEWVVKPKAVRYEFKTER